MQNTHPPNLPEASQNHRTTKSQTPHPWINKQSYDLISSHLHPPHLPSPQLNSGPSPTQPLPPPHLSPIFLPLSNTSNRAPNTQAYFTSKKGLPLLYSSTILPFTILARMHTYIQPQMRLNPYPKKTPKNPKIYLPMRFPESKSVLVIFIHL